ncbi:hypothetical protein GOA63_26700 [Sinorhizobium meliloti]|uniref:hypothetical protein n=1 Tax=Rhizobium meliloti TaxID=382 RepID=UPI001297EB22|nr:hypothetical protein [Sinorhizobium meliloti]MCG5486002.1 hypothetical protein [Sinorhizobium meliloti]MDW9595770.1 hypothetical protein [Sinorhizobium meliloti]MDX0189451.1 hypothetical protein [Sinorhizobium meliloti]MQV62823.1 hypothetical protein [Sinorhizobium meliloti]
MHVRNNKAIDDDEGNDRKNDPKHGAMPTKPNHANEAEAELVAAMAEMDAKEEASYRASRFATEQHPLDGPGLTPSRCRQRQLYHRLMSDWYGHKLGEIQR